ncbi:UNVERIFIED_CONTAM: hypothetical protein Sindi_2135200 [Sesamum indicum]
MRWKMRVVMVECCKFKFQCLWLGDSWSRNRGGSKAKEARWGPRWVGVRRDAAPSLTAMENLSLELSRVGSPLDSSDVARASRGSFKRQK